MNNWIFALVLEAMVCIGGSAYAHVNNEQVIAQQGDWAAVSFGPTQEDPLSVCATGVAPPPVGYKLRAARR